jgi:hypothetical protein
MKLNFVVPFPLMLIPLALHYGGLLFLGICDQLTRSKDLHEVKLGYRHIYT